MIKQINTPISALTLVSMLYCSAAGAHGKVSMEQDTCIRRLEDYSMVHFRRLPSLSMSPATNTLQTYQGRQYSSGNRFCRPGVA